MPSRSSIDIDNPKQTITSCFRMMHYVVPAFQREFVWENEQIETLLNDVKDAFEYDNEKEYFVGSTVVYKEDNNYQLVDGQQRMTTFFLILCAIAKRYEEKGEDARGIEQLVFSSTTNSNGETVNTYSLELQYQDSSDCLKNIWEDTIPDENDALPASCRRIYDGYKTVTDKLRTDYPVFDEFKKFAGYYLNKVVFIQVGATSMSDALKIFETINQRGVTLNPMDLLKNMLFMHVKESQFNELNTKWKSMVDDLDKNKEKPLRFLRYYITATYDISDKKPDFQGILNEDDIYEWLTKNNDKCHYKEEPINFTNKMVEGLKRYLGFLSPDNTVKGKDYLLDIIAIMGRSNRLHLVPLMSSTQMDDSLRSRLFKLFDLVTYYAVVNKIQSNVLERLYSSWCPSIRNISDEKEFDTFVKMRVMPTINNWNVSYRNSFGNLSLANTQKYKIKAILARIYKYVDAYRENSNDYADITEYLKSLNEIEHIMPDNCTNPAGYGFEDQDSYDYYKQRLGNLALLEKTINSTIQDDDYDSKCIAYGSSKFYLTKSMKALIPVGGNTAINRMNGKLKAWNDWNKHAIDDRQSVLYELSREIWNIDSV